jgi:ribosome-associated protein YbcJ (S4-like RNA binding protein)
VVEQDGRPVIALEQFLKREGAVETRRKRKLHPGDRVELGGQELTVDDLSD